VVELLTRELLELLGVLGPHCIELSSELGLGCCLLLTTSFLFRLRPVVGLGRRVGRDDVTLGADATEDEENDADREQDPLPVQLHPLPGLLERLHVQFPEPAPSSGGTSAVTATASVTATTSDGGLDGRFGAIASMTPFTLLKM